MRKTLLPIAAFFAGFAAALMLGSGVAAKAQPQLDQTQQYEATVQDLRTQLAEIRQEQSDADAAAIAPVPVNVRPAVREAARREQIPLQILVALGTQETGWDCSEIGKAGEIGCLQVLPATAREVAKTIGLQHYDLHNPEDNIRIGARYLRQLWNQDHDWSHALAAYNGGPDWRDKPITTVYAAEVLAKAMKGETNR